VAHWLAGVSHPSQPRVGGGIAEDLSDSPLVHNERTPAQMGSPYVPVDSWIYPLFDRLIATGAITDAILGMRPWTRLECATDLVTTSASGLDPEISPAAAEFQIPRVARERHMSETDLRALVAKHTLGRQFSVLGEPRVNVVELNLDLDASHPRR
jgi:K+-transporting ATPase ATPase C chain